MSKFNPILKPWPRTIQYTFPKPSQLSKKRTIPPYITSSTPNFLTKIPIKTQSQLQKLKVSCKLAKHILNFAGDLIKPDITTEQIDHLGKTFISLLRVFKEIIACGGYPSPLGYYNFPKSICTSVIVHGIPDSRPLINGDIINIDITVYVDGFHGDTSKTFAVGSIDNQAIDLINAAKSALDAGISACKPYVHVSEISKSIESFIKTTPFSICPDFTGHGIGEGFHEPPMIFHSEGSVDVIMEPGMAFTIEPAINEGLGGIVEWNDGWTVVTVDGLRSAQFEHTIFISEDGVEVLT